MLAIERRNQILNTLQQDKRVVVSELSRRYGVSEETIRRDLERLAREGLAVKSYGGAVTKEDVSIDLPFNIRKNQNIAGKQKMAEIAASLVHEGEHLFLDASTTAVFAAKALRARQRLTVITNSMEILLELSDLPDWNVYCTGGRLREGYLAFLGSSMEESARSFYADTMICSCKALDIKKGIMESQEDFRSAKKAMMASARRKILLVDASKFGKSAFSIVGDLRSIDVLITDQKPSKDWQSALFEAGVELKYPE